jgi:hypothetical protein
MPIQTPTAEANKRTVVCIPLSSHPVRHSKSNSSLAKRNSGTPERPRGRNSASERPSRPARPDEKEDEKEDDGEDRQLRKPRNRQGRIFTDKDIEDIFADEKKGTNEISHAAVENLLLIPVLAAAEEPSHYGHRSRSTSTSSRSSDEDQRRQDGESRSRYRSDPSNSRELRKSGGGSPSRERGSRMELVEGKKVKVRGCDFTLVTKRRSDE